MKRQDSRTAKAAVDAFRNASLGEIDPPKTVKLRAGDIEIWRMIMRARARDEWSDPDLHHAANLTRCLADIERISSEIESDGDTVKNDRGTQIVNPKHALLETLSRRSVALTRLLHLHASVLVGRPETAVGARAAEASAREAIVDDAEDGLLGTPSRLQ